jgi:hypothetical protein
MDVGTIVVNCGCQKVLPKGAARLEILGAGSVGF